MSFPSTPEQKWSWWESAVAGNFLPHYEDDPQVGFYRIRRWRRKPYWLAARIWLEPGEVDPETGELLSDEWLCAEIDGVRKNPFKIWTWLEPISLEDYEWLIASRPLQPKKEPKSKPPPFQRPSP